MMAAKRIVQMIAVLLLFVAGPLTAQGRVRTYGYLALQNAAAHVYVRDSAGRSTVRVGLWSHDSLTVVVWQHTTALDSTPRHVVRYYGAGYELTPALVTSIYVPTLRRLAVAVDSGAVIEDRFSLPRATVRLQCWHGACWATFWNIGLPDSLVTTPPVPARYLDRFALALEAAVRGDTGRSIPVVKDSLILDTRP